MRTIICKQTDKVDWKAKSKGYVSIILGIIFCASVLVGYIPIPEYFIELTCFSNMLSGILLIVTGIKFLMKGKGFSSIFYHMGLVTVLLVCMVSCVGHFNFRGAFFFLHFVNPVLMLLYYLFFIEDDKSFKKVLYTPIPVIIYLVFDYVIGKVTGHFVYGIFDVDEMNPAWMILVACGIYVILLLIACITQFFNRKCSVLRRKLYDLR